MLVARIAADQLSTARASYVEFGGGGYCSCNGAGWCPCKRRGWRRGPLILLRSSLPSFHDGSYGAGRCSRSIARAAGAESLLAGSGLARLGGMLVNGADACADLGAATVAVLSLVCPLHLTARGENVVKNEYGIFLHFSK